MTRVKSGMITHKKHKKALDRSKGYRGHRGKLYNQAKIAQMQAGLHSFKDRKNRKRVFRKLWIARVNAACRAMGTSYSRLIDGMTKKNILIDRKILADLAVSEKDTFDAIVKAAK